MAKEFPRRAAEAVREVQPDLPMYWTLTDLSAQAGLRGLALTHANISTLVIRGQGPRVCGTAGSMTVLVKPADGVEWIEEILQRRMKTAPSTIVRRYDLDEERRAVL
ncbi:hypothetical protein [Rhizobium sp. RAF56]|uniref:hypothetical protein n=1 Tax=Rhizobium sp. RAF56 TaxID=3233062 RepID=UPI003F9BADE1